MLPVNMYAGGRSTPPATTFTRASSLVRCTNSGCWTSRIHSQLRLHGLIIKDGAKMSKSRGNVVNPDEYIDRYGSDNIRVYLLLRTVRRAATSTTARSTGSSASTIG
jgi:leucyl-tRNA synthetase